MVGCVAAVVSAFHDGNGIVQKIKDKRRERKALLPSRYLEESLERGPTAVEQEKSIGIERFGDKFAGGDSE